MSAGRYRNTDGVDKIRRKISERLIDRLRAEHGDLNIPKDATLRNNRPGHWQRSAGAWLWEVDFGSRFSGRQIGSQWTMGQCLKAKKLVVSPCGDFDIYIDPDPEPKA